MANSLEKFQSSIPASFILLLINSVLIVPMFSIVATPSDCPPVCFFPPKEFAFHLRIPPKPQESACLTPVCSDWCQVVILDRENHLKLNGQLLNRTDLGDKLKKKLSALPSNVRFVYIEAPRGIQYKVVLEIVELVKTSGGIPLLQLDSPKE